MIAPPYVRTMAAYNSEMNRRLYAAADRLSDTERKADRGAFFRSIHATFSHLVWADRAWMSRFAGWAMPDLPIAKSGELFERFDEMAAARAEDDRQIEAWAGDLDEAWLEGDLTWFSGAAGREMTKPRALIVMHVFNHQIHHRGQAHAMLTAAGEATGATDLLLVLAG